MTLKSNALITVDELLSNMNLSRTNLRTDFFTIYNSASDATTAVISVLNGVLTLTVTGGASAHSNTFTLSASAYDTIAELVAAIEALGKNWVVNRATSTTQLSTNLFSLGSTSALGIASEQTIQGFNLEYWESLINSGSQFIENYCRRKFVSASYTEYLDGTGDDKLLVKNFPVTALTTIKLFDWQTNSVLYTYTEHSEYTNYLDEGIIYRSAIWQKGHKNFQVVYTAGYTSATMPDDIKSACYGLCELSYQTHDKVGINSETIGQYSVDYSNTEGATFFMGVAVPPSIITLLGPYVKYDAQDIN